MTRRLPDDRALLPLVGPLVDQRYAAAVESVSLRRHDDPHATPDELADALIRRCARDLAIGGAVTGGAAAAPVAGITVAATAAGADATYSIGRLSEMIMAIGLVYGHELHSPDERTSVVLAVLGLSEGAAVGLTGIAARLGSRGGARLVSRLPANPSTPATAGVTRRAMAKLSSSRGPWSLAALIPYGIGAGVGAAGNTVLAHTVGRAAKQHFSTNATDEWSRHRPLVEDAGEGEIVEDQPAPPPVQRVETDVVDAVIVEAVIVDP